MNPHIKDMKGEAIKFAKEAEKLLAQYKNVLPEKHLCSDTRHTKDKKIAHRRDAGSRTMLRAVFLLLFYRRFYYNVRLMRRINPGSHQALR